MKITVLDGYTENPGDLSWDWLEALGETSIYDCTPDGLIAERSAGCEIIITNKTLRCAAKRSKSCPSCATSAC